MLFQKNFSTYDELKHIENKIYFLIVGMRYLQLRVNYFMMILI